MKSLSKQGRRILKSVSRSFYLSIRLLPVEMREPISLGYLLARASDTLADTEGLEAQLRFDMLTGFTDFLDGRGSGDWIVRVREEVIPLQQHDGEKILLENLEKVFEWLGSVSADLQTIIRQLMRNILRGQKLDVERFDMQQGGGFDCDDELDKYCYLVAGCVGEFWTEVGVMTVSEFSDIEVGKLKNLGVNYGKGLQLINILRDLPADLEQGRCYLPLNDRDDVQEIMYESARWREVARSYLSDGETYARSLRVKRSRIATALPGMIGERTIEILDSADWAQLQGGVKVSRSQVYRCLWNAFFSNNVDSSQ